MTQTNDPPLISSLELIPDAAEKADLDAPNDSGGKLVIGQAPNITITETTVVADAAERLALDVQEGDVAVQTNVSSSFIFTGGDNIAPNWQTIDFDAVGAIDSEDINPRDITARVIDSSLDITAVNIEVSDTLNGANISSAAAGEALTSNGSGGFSFASVGGDLESLVSATPESVGGFVSSSGAMNVIADSQTAVQEVTASQPAMEEIQGSPTADSIFYLSDNYAGALDAFAGINTGVTGGIDDIAVSQQAMEEVAASQTAMEQVAASQTAMEKIGSSNIAQTEIENSSTAINELNSVSTSFSFSYSGNRNTDERRAVTQTDEAFLVYIDQATYTGSTISGTSNRGWYDRNDNYLGSSISNVFVDQLTLGWESNTTSSVNQTLSGNIEAVIFQ